MKITTKETLKILLKGKEINHFKEVVNKISMPKIGFNQSIFTEDEKHIIEKLVTYFENDE